MAAWPELDELKQVLNVESDDWDGEDYEDVTRLSRALAAGIAYTQLRVGNWNDYEDEPDDMLAQAALRAAVLFAGRPEPTGEDTGIIASDPTFTRLLFGHRRRFGVA